jgi:flagellar motor switch protein FliM
VKEFLNLNIGDVVALDESTKSPVKMTVENKVYCYGKPGVMGKSMGVEILDIISKDVENYE